jgi:hypothetical protein
MTPPDRLNVCDKHGGFTIVKPSGDTLWRPALRRDTRGTLIANSVKPNTFYQQNDNVTSADYRLPRLRFPSRVWWDNATGERIA